MAWVARMALRVVQCLLDRFGDLVRDLCCPLMDPATSSSVDVSHSFGVIGGQLGTIDESQRDCQPLVDTQSLHAILADAS